MSSKTWILLRGLGRETGHWNDFPKILQERFPNDKILPLDLPGAGEFNDVIPPLRISEYVDFLRNELFNREVSLEATHERDENSKSKKRNKNNKILKNNDNKSEYCLLAVSLGGMVALEWMRRFPGEIKTGVLINTSLSNTSWFYNRLRWQIYPQFFLKVAGSKGYKRERALLPLLSEFYSNYDSIAEKWTNVSQQRPMKATSVVRQLLAASNYKIKTKVTPPTVLLSSLNDRLVSPKCSQDIHKKFNYPILHHLWGGHDLTTDDPEWVADQVLHWVQLQKI